MKSSAKKIELASVDDLFSTEEVRQDAKLEKIQEIPLSELHPFKNHLLPRIQFLMIFNLTCKHSYNHGYRRTHDILSMLRIACMSYHI